MARSGTNGLLRSDYVPMSLRYRVNKWADIVNEVTWYDTRLGHNVGAPPAGSNCTSACIRVLFRGIDSRVNHDLREEFGTVFTF